MRLVGRQEPCTSGGASPLLYRESRRFALEDRPTVLWKRLTIPENHHRKPRATEGREDCDPPRRRAGCSRIIGFLRRRQEEEEDNESNYGHANEHGRWGSSPTDRSTIRSLRRPGE